MRLEGEEEEATPWVIDEVVKLEMEFEAALDVVTRELGSTGAEVVGGLTLQRGRLAAHSEEFAARLADAVSVA